MVFEHYKSTWKIKIDLKNIIGFANIIRVASYSSLVTSY